MHMNKKRAHPLEGKSTSNEISYEYYLLLCQPTQLQCGFLFFLSWSFCHLMSSLFALCHRNSVNAAIDAAATAADTQFVFNFDVCSVHGFCREKNQQFILILLCFHFLEKKEKLCKNRKKCAKFWVFQDL